jgi:hypothetical protein
MILTSYIICTGIFKFYKYWHIDGLFRPKPVTNILNNKIKRQLWQTEYMFYFILIKYCTIRCSISALSWGTAAAMKTRDNCVSSSSHVQSSKKHSPRDLRIKTGRSFAHAQINADLFRNEFYSPGDLQCSQQRLGCTSMFIITEVLRRSMSRFQSSFLRLPITVLTLSSLASHEGGGFLWPAATTAVSRAWPDTHFLDLFQLHNSPNISETTLLPWTLGKHIVHLQRFLLLSKSVGELSNRPIVVSHSDENERGMVSASHVSYIIYDNKQHRNTPPRNKGYNVMLYVTPTDAHL